MGKYKQSKFQKNFKSLFDGTWRVKLANKYSLQLTDINMAEGCVYISLLTIIFTIVLIILL